MRLRLHLAYQRVPDAVCEVDLLVSDVDVLSETNERRVRNLLRSAMEGLPGIEEA
jgi:hypothetical protein